jgi:hypothetical protein
MRHTFRTPPFFTFFHCSDIHVGRTWDAPGRERTALLQAVRADLEATVRHVGFRPSVILVTGDIAATGAARDADEFVEVATWLGDMAADQGLSARDVLTTIGNHDVPRISPTERQLRRLIDRLRAGEEMLDEARHDTRDRRLLSARLDAYQAFASRFGAAHTDLGCWTQRRPIDDDLSVRLIGLNTSLLCADDRDRGRLACGQWLLHDALPASRKDAEIVFLLTHHPLSWLRDGESIGAWTRRHAHVHLFGHLHEANTITTSSGGGSVLLEIAAGAVHDSSGPNGRWGYSIGGLWRRPDGGVIARIWPRVWSPYNWEFRQDSDNVPDRTDFATHRLAIRLPPMNAVQTCATVRTP